MKNGQKPLKSGSKRKVKSSKKIKSEKKTESDFVANKTALKPNRKMKALHWKRKVISKGNESETKNEGTVSVWNSVQEINGIDFNEFESLFCAPTAPKKKKKTAPKKKKSAANEPIRCLPFSRTHSLGILLSSLPPIDELRECIVSVNRKVLSTDSIEQILSKLPSKEEVESIRQFEKENVDRFKVSKWALAEQFCLKMGSIPQCRQRLNLWIFINSFDAEYDAMMETVSCYKNSCIELEQNKDLPQILSLILTVGNYMNGGTRKGQADGFDLDILTKLDAVKGLRRGSKTQKNGKSANITLLDYVVKCCYEQNGNRKLVLSESMQNVLRCPNRGKLNEIKQRAMGLIHKLKSVETMKQRLDPKEKDNIRFLEELDVFITNNNKQRKGADHLRRAVDDTVKGYQQIIVFYDEPKRKGLDKSKEFMKIWSDFIVLFDNKMEELDEMKKGNKAENQDQATKHRKHNLGKKIPGISHNAKATGMLMHELKNALSAKHLTT